METVKRNRKSSVSVSKSLDVGDQILITVGLTKFVSISKYSGSRDIADPANYIFVEEIAHGKLKNLFSPSLSKSVFKVAAISNNYPSKGTLKNFIEKDIKILHRGYYPNYSLIKYVEDLLNLAIENSPNADVPKNSNGEVELFTELRSLYLKFKLLPVVEQEEQVDVIKKQITDLIELYSKSYQIESKYLGM